LVTTILHILPSIGIVPIKLIATDDGIEASEEGFDFFDSFGCRLRGDGKYIALRKVMMSEYPTVHSLMVEILITSGFRAEC